MFKKYLYIVFFLYSSFLVGQTPLTVAEDFSVKAIDGSTLVLYDILDAGQYVLIDFFEVNCGPCQVFAPDLQQSYLSFGENQQDVFFMGISHIANNTIIHEWDSIYGIQFPSVSGIQGGGFDVHEDYGIVSVPTLVLIAPDKSIVGQIFLPDIVPNSANIASMLMEHGVFPVLTGSDKNLEEKNKISLFPNPVANDLNIQIDMGVDLSKVDVKINSLNGNLIFEKTYTKLKQRNIKMNVSGIKPGFYFVEVKAGSEIIEIHKIYISR